MCVPRSTIFSKFLDSFNRLEFVEVFIFVSSSLTKLMHFSQALFSPAHIYGAICIVLVIEQPGWHYMTKCLYNRQVGSSESFICFRFVGKGSKLYTDWRRKLNCHICQDSFLSSMFHFILSYWACNWTFLSTLLHFWFQPSLSFYHITFLASLFSPTVSRLVTRRYLPWILDPLFSLYLLLLEIIFWNVPLLAL